MGERAGQSGIIGKNDVILDRSPASTRLLGMAKSIFSGTKHSKVALNLWDLGIF